MTSRAPSAPAARPETDGDAVRAMARGPRALPTMLRTSPAFLHPAAGEVGVVLAGGWGYEELCTRRALCELAEALSDAGYPTLRFDFPGCGGALGDLETARVEDWIAAVGEAADLLRRTCGARRIVLGGFGLGALVALEAGRRGAPCEGLLLLGAPASGKRWLRETRVWAAQVASPGDGAERAPEGALVIGGFVLPAARVAEISALRGGGFALPAQGAAIMVARDGLEHDTLAAAFAASGAAVDHLSFAGFEDLVSGPTTALTPVATFARATAALKARMPPGRAARVGAQAPAQRLQGETFVETGVRFGVDDYLFGVLCRPASAPVGAPVAVFLNVGRNPHSGWRRMAVEQARALAAAGVASLRFDLGGVGESARLAGAPARIVYDGWAKRDVAAALTMLDAQGFGPATIVGVCSGAWLALHAAVDDARAGGLVCVNLYRVVWGPHESVEHAMRFANRPLGDAVARFLTWEKIAGIARGRVDPRPGLRRLYDKARARLEAATLPWLGRLHPRHALHAQALRLFGALQARGVATTLGYARDDDGWQDIQFHFGGQARRLAAFPNVRLTLIEGCDHNLTPPEAGAWLLSAIRATVAETTH